MSTTFDLFNLGLEAGTYSISAVAKAKGYADSGGSEVVNCERGATTFLGTWVLNREIDWSQWGATARSLYYKKRSTASSFTPFMRIHASSLGYLYIWHDGESSNKIAGDDDSTSTGTVFYENGAWKDDDYRTWIIEIEPSGFSSGNYDDILSWLNLNGIKVA